MGQYLYISCMKHLIPYSLKLSFLLFLGHLSLAAFPQNSLPKETSDSLWSVWQDTAQPDTSRLKALSKFAWEGFLFSRPDSALFFAQLQYEFAQKKGLQLEMGEAMNTQGVAQSLLGNYSGALNCFMQHMDISEKSGDKLRLASGLSNIGNIYCEQGDYVKGLKYFSQSLKAFNEINHQPGIATGLNSIGTIYHALGNHKKALEYYLRSLDISRELSDSTGMTFSMINLGIVEKDLGNFEKALRYYQECLEIRNATGDISGIATAYVNMGNTYRAAGDNVKAYENYQLSHDLSRDIGDKGGETYSLTAIGLLKNEQNKFAEGVEWCQRALAVARELGAIEHMKLACECLYKAHKALGNGLVALQHHEWMLAYTDSLNREEINQKLQQMEFSKVLLQDSLSKAAQALRVEEMHKDEVRKKNTTRNLLIGISLFVLMLAGAIFSRLQYTRKSKAALQMEKDRSESLLHNILPEEIAEELKQSGRAKARNYDLVSILFTDFIGFTEVSAQLNPEELVNEINACFEYFDRIVEKFGIEKIKTIGDAYMAAGGLPVPDAQSVKRTILAGIEMQNFINQRRQINQNKGIPAFQMRVGIHTGPVVAGIVGVKKFQYDIWGDAVNTAARMESSGNAGKVNISSSTYNLLKDAPEFAFTSRGRIEAKGKGEMEMWYVDLKPAENQ